MDHPQLKKRLTTQGIVHFGLQKNLRTQRERNARLTGGLITLYD